MEIPRHWRLKAQRYRLEGSTCPICGRFSFPPRPVCRDCAYQPMRVASWEFPEVKVTTAMHRHDGESRMTCEIPESVIR
ncbi:MAG: zinc ribbon domain-containing protein [Byssovorax cruenta]